MKDMEPRVPLNMLDPESTEAGYWAEFRGEVLRAAAPELAGRRRARFTIESQVVSWSRTILPIAAAAAVAALMLVTLDGGSGVTETFAGLEDVIGASLDGEQPLPYFLHSDVEVDRDAILFAIEQAP